MVLRSPVLELGLAELGLPARRDCMMQAVICSGGNQRHGKVEGVGMIHPGLQKSF